MDGQNELKMPENWNDQWGWDRYYESRIASGNDSRSTRDVGSIPFAQLSEFVKDLKLRHVRSVWIPGCGISPLAHLLAHLGLEVIATDISQVAIKFQRERKHAFGYLAERLGPSDSTGSLIVENHDFLCKFRQDAFDLIINVKAIQGFPPFDICRIAENHAVALRKGRVAYFDTMNVQGERRDQLEEALQDSGFVVPLLKLNRWYRTTLRDTGIPHIFILGQPMIPRSGKYADGGTIWNNDTARLREISAEYRTRLKVEHASEQMCIGADAKVAQIIYSTG